MDSTPQSRILVVDDDPAICHLLTSYLNLSGLTSQSSTSGEAALNLLSKETFDAVISDLNMPGISGLDLLEATRHLAPRTAFLMATGVNDAEVGVTAMKHGAADYLLKPFHMEDVVVSLRRALEMKRMEAELEDYRQRLAGMVEERTKQLMVAMRRIELTYEETLEALAAALDLRDNNTAGHSRRVTLYSLEMARRVNFSSDQLKHMEMGAYMHDIGKIGIPDSILFKPGMLTPEERRIMQSHARIGHELMSRVAFLASAAEIVLNHHECYDGTGYPRGLAGEEIPLAARIFAISDTLDAMTSDRPYRRGVSYSDARDEIGRMSMKQFDPRIVSVFLSIPEEVWVKIRNEATRSSFAERHASTDLTAKRSHSGVDGILDKAAGLG